MSDDDRGRILNRVLEAIAEQHSGNRAEGLLIRDAAIAALLRALADEMPDLRDLFLSLCGWLRL